MSAQDPTPSAPLHPRDYLILLALTEGPRHGYRVLKEIEDITKGEVRFDPANLYRSLKKLMRHGLVEEVDQPDPRADDGRRRYFALTDTGHHAVRAEAARMAHLARVARDRNLLPGSSPR
jgi:DNA-binding PadR family transcriptional regulator